MNNRVFANNLLRQREALGLSADDFALSIGVSSDEYASWERGDTMPPLDIAKRIAEKCGITIDEMMAGSYQPKMRFGSEDGVSEDEKKREWAEYEAASDRRYFKGKRIMLAIIITEIVALILSFLFQSLLVSILQIVMLVFLWHGKSWARYVFAVLCALSGVFNLMSLAVLSDVLPLLVIAVLVTVYQFTAAAMVLWSPSVEEFLTDQDHTY